MFGREIKKLELQFGLLSSGSNGTALIAPGLLAIPHPSHASQACFLVFIFEDLVFVSKQIFQGEFSADFF
ncbi:unnamed protein product [Allacma fusca]|uniref:Uncharacterized protein n=1 Tax=Allacma fusca TaxID=39272 RepID=A0A8J2LTI7_9HEXA|nr:unnamed protein product [Allacma fusca]